MTLKVAIASFAHGHAMSYAYLLNQVPDVEVLSADQDVLTLRRGGLTVVLNAGAETVELPSGNVVLASGPVEDGLLPPDTAAWIA